MQICEKIQNEGWQVEWIEDQDVPYAHGNGEWVGFDNPDSFVIKVDIMFSIYLLIIIMLVFEYLLCVRYWRIGFVLRHVVYIIIEFSGVVNLSIEYYLPKFGKTIKNTPLLHRKYLILSIYSCFSGDFIIPVAITGEVHYKWYRNRLADPFICAPSKVRGTNWQFTFLAYDIGKSSFKRPNPTISLIHSPFLFQKHGIALAAGDIIVNYVCVSGKKYKCSRIGRCFHLVGWDGWF